MSKSQVTVIQGGRRYEGESALDVLLDPNFSTAQPEATVLFGSLKLVIDPSLPRGEVRVHSANESMRLINLGEDSAAD